MKIELFPLDKMLIDGASIFLGMEQAAVEATIGKGESIGNRQYYYDNEMAIDYTDDKRVEFIEFLGGIDGELHPTIYGVSAFDMNADELAEVLRSKNNGEVDDSDYGYSLTFLNSCVGIYRDATPSSVTEMIEEMKEEGIDTEDNEDIKEEWKRANHWATIGIGAANYYK